MFFVDKPYVSAFLKSTLKEHHIPVVATDALPQLELLEGTTILDAGAALDHAAGPNATPIYMNSENAIGWLAEHAQFKKLSERIDLFKNKVKFRDLTRPLFPDFHYRAIALQDVATTDYETLVDEGFNGPFILKPAIGFFSMGVYYIANRDDWLHAQSAIIAEMTAVEGLYPTEVMDSNQFILESCIEGDEYAVDAYFDADGAPVILSIFKHAFAGEDDVSDRIYLTSKDIIETCHAKFSTFLKNIGQLAEVSTFPVHVELRMDEEGNILPIEVNPMRFGGWCTTADLTAKAYGINPYLAYLNQEKPDWGTALQGKDGKLYALIVLDNSTGIDEKDIAAFDYDAVLAGLETPLELRKININEYPVFGFIMCETRSENFAELEQLLLSDLSEFVTRF